VSKDVDAGRTKVRIVQAEGEARVAEIARMLGGEELTSVVKRHAKELLQLSR
jgi:DNA repair protein RecN (Recombination protein N)